MQKKKKREGDGFVTKEISERFIENDVEAFCHQETTNTQHQPPAFGVKSIPHHSKICVYSSAHKETSG